MKIRRLFLGAAVGLALTACGDDGDGKAVALVSTETLDFGSVACGTTQVPRVFQLANSGLVPFTFTSAFEKGTHYMVQPSTGFVLPGQQVQLTVYSAAIPQTSAVTDNLYGDTLTITTDITGEPAHAIALTQTARGAILELSSATVTIPGVHTVIAPATAPLTIRNVGNAPATNVEVAGAAAFSFAPGAIATIAPGESIAGTVTYRATTAGAESESITITRADGLCGALPAPTRASGEGTFAGVIPTKLALIGGQRFRSSSYTLFAVLPGGYVASFGGNDRGMRGGGSSIPSANAPTLVRTAGDRLLDGVVDVVGNRAGACALRTDRSVYCWGNVSMARGRDEFAPQPFATPLVESGATAVGMGYGLRCLSREPDGTIECQANGTDVFVGGWTLTGAAEIDLHQGGGYATLADGTLMSFGSNNSGERGNTDPDNSPPSAVVGLTGVSQVITASGKPNDGDKRTACARKADGTVACWGFNRHGRLGNGTTTESSTPVAVMIDATTPLTGVTAIAGGHGHVCAATATNVYCWGCGKHRRLGRDTGDTNPYAQPVDTAIAGVTSLAASQRGACALLPTGRITCFGRTPLSEDVPTNYDVFAASP